MIVFNLLEHDLTYVLWALCRTPSLLETELILSHINSFETRITLFSQLATYRFKDKRTKERIRHLVARLRNTNNRRNDLIHGTWKSLGNPAFVVKYQRQKPTIGWRQIEASPKSIRADAKKAWNTWQAVRRFAIVVTALNARERKSRERATLRDKS
jgi:hypothetical protein